MNKISVKNSICYITLDNKPQNYLTKPEFIDREELTNSIISNSCKAILINGAGRHFSAGADMSTIYEMLSKGNLHEEMNAGKELLQYIQTFNIPVVSTIEGVCFGGGLEIVLNSDIRIASDKALFAFPETNNDLMPGLSGTQVFTKLVGKAKSLEVILSGDVITAETASELSVVDYITEKKKSLSFGELLLAKMVNNRPLHVIKAVVESIRNTEKMSYKEALDEETRLFCELAKKVAGRVNEDI